MPDPITAAVVGGTTLVSGKMQADAAEDAAAMQVAGGDRALAQQLRMFEMGREDMAPYRETGYTALKDIERLMPMFTQQFGPEQLEQYLDPSMAFRMKYGTKATERAANVGGGLLSGNTLRSLTEFGQDLASTEYANAFNRAQTEPTNIFNRLHAISGLGQNAVTTGVQAQQAYGNQASNIMTGQAAAQAAGTVGQANAYAGAIGNIGNMAMMNAFMNPAVARPGMPAGAPAATMQVPINMNLA
jgi:hypothetical protein